jgi:hypothetical protein
MMEKVSRNETGRVSMALMLEEGCDIGPLFYLTATVFTSCQLVYRLAYCIVVAHSIDRRTRGEVEAGSDKR